LLYDAVQKAGARGIEPRVTALLGSFLITTVVLFPHRELSHVPACASTLLVLVGDSRATVVVVQLRGSFSVMAEVRRLEVLGVYRLVGHPLYLAEEIATIGGVIQLLSSGTITLLAVQISSQIRRMKTEEIVLTTSFLPTIRII